MTNTPQALTSGPVTAHLVRLAIPASVGMLFNTLYNLTDFWFAGLLSDDALAGVSIAGSVFFLILSVGFGMQTGVSAVIAPELGKQKPEKAADYVDNAVGLGLLMSFMVMIAGYFFADDLVSLLGADGEVKSLSLAYLLVTFVGAAAFILSFVAAGALIAFGDTKTNRNVLIIGFFANIVINPLLTFTLGLGVTGLALATVLIKAVSTLYLFSKLRTYTGRPLKPGVNQGYFIELLKQVMPASFNMLTIILGGFITVGLIGRFGSEYVAGYAVGLRLEQVLLLPVLGLNSALIALAGQNFGAQYPDRIIDAYRSALKIGFCMSALSIPVMVFLSPLMMGFFTDNASIIDTGATYLRIDAVAFFAYVVLFQSTACLQGIKQPLFPMVMGVSRQLVLPACINFVLIVYFDMPMISVFFTIVSVVLVSAVISHFYTRGQLRKLLI